GEDRPLLEQRARQTAALLARIRGVVDVAPGVVVSGPNLTFTPTAEGRRLGLDAATLADAVRPAIAGIEAGGIVRGARAAPLRVALPPGGGVPALDALPVSVGSGRTRPLAELATVRADTGETEIHRDDMRTSISVTARLEGRDMGSAMREVRGVLARNLALPAGMAPPGAARPADQ